MPKRISRRFIPKPNRRESRPNVFIQAEKPSGDAPSRAVADTSPSANGQVSAGASPVMTARRRGVRQVRPKSEVFLRTLGKELRQSAVLSAAAVAVVIILAFALR